jgi:hypothetical protein
MRMLTLTPADAECVREYLDPVLEPGESAVARLGNRAAVAELQRLLGRLDALDVSR